MTRSRSSVSRRESRSPRDRVSELIFRLQNEALSALREKEWPGTLTGKRITEDEELLQLYFKMIAPALEKLETYFPKGSSKVAHRDDAFNLLLFLLRAAHFIGSRARMSLSQQTYFASKRGSDLGKRSGAKRATDAAETWKPHALELALVTRTQDPTLSQASVAAAVLSSWRLKIPLPKHETVCRFIALQEKTGQLPPRRR
jgi:hypothetical protein